MRKFILAFVAGFLFLAARADAQTCAQPDPAMFLTIADEKS